MEGRGKARNEVEWEEVERERERKWGRRTRVLTDEEGGKA